MVAAQWNPIARLGDLYPALLTQVGALLAVSTCLDHGQSAAAMADVSVGFWCGVVIVLIRRHKAMTNGDHQYIRYGLFLLLVVGLPVTLTIWAYRGIY